MKADVLELLIGLFSKKVHGQAPRASKMTLEHALSLATMDKVDVTNAIHWLDSLVKQARAARQDMKPSDSAIRMYSHEERERLGSDCIQLLTDWQNMRVITALQREVIIEQMLSLEVSEVSMNQIRWVAFLVLTADSKNPEQIFWLEYILLNPEQIKNRH